MFAMTVVFLLAMAALSGPDFLQSVASRTGLPFLGAWASSRTSSSANDGAIALPADSSPHAHSKGRKGASSSRRVPKANKSSPAALSPSSSTKAVAGAAYGIVRVLLPGDSQPVLIDGLPRGNTPLLARLPVGTHSISLVGTHPVLPEQVRLTLKAGDTLLALFTPRP